MSQFAVYRVDSEVKPFIRQEALPPQMSAKAEGSEYEHDTDMHEFGVRAVRNVAYGFWQQSTLVQMKHS